MNDLSNRYPHFGCADARYWCCVLSIVLPCTPQVANAQEERDEALRVRDDALRERDAKATQV